MTELEPYERLQKAFFSAWGARGRQVLESRIEAYVKHGLSREEAILEVAKDEGWIDEEEKSTRPEHEASSVRKARRQFKVPVNPSILLLATVFILPFVGVAIAYYETLSSFPSLILTYVIACFSVLALAAFSSAFKGRFSRKKLLLLTLGVMVLSITIVNSIWRSRIAEEIRINPVFDVSSATFSKTVNDTIVEVGEIVEVRVSFDWHGRHERNVKVVDPVHGKYFSVVGGSNVFEYRGKGPGPDFTYTLEVVGGLGLSFRLGSPNFTLDGTPVPLSGSAPKIEIGKPISVSYLLSNAEEYAGRTLRIRGKVKLFLLKPTTFLQDFWLVDTEDSRLTIPVQLSSGKKPLEHTIVTLETKPMWLPSISGEGGITYTFTLFMSEILD